MANRKSSRSETFFHEILSSTNRIFGVLVVILVSGCPTPEVTDAGPPALFDCELGVAGSSLGEFVPLSERDTAELALGFQGLAFAPVRVRASGDVPLVVDAILSATIEGREPFGGRQALIEFSGPADALVSSDIQISVNRGNFADYANQVAQIDIRLRDDMTNPTKECLVSGLVTLVDDDDCIHTGDVPICNPPADAGIFELDGGQSDGGESDGGKPANDDSGVSP
ncbi:MAG: hypothetical protein GY822_07850 [Deltaproteobacteria bacterium]|nr:hypothetical protein [Deltaproteobacteria bacterium]